MNVTNGIENVAQIFPSQAATSQATPKSANNAPSESLSSDSAQLSITATQAAQATVTSDVRLDKVASIREALQSGTYQVSASDVAQKVIDSMFTTEK
jgi:flagellar biosynthesis anti-sigma factor FlgM